MDNEHSELRCINASRQALENALSRSCGANCRPFVRVFQQGENSFGNTGIFHCYARQAFRAGFGLFVKGDEAKLTSDFHYCVVSCSNCMEQPLHLYSDSSDIVLTHFCVVCIICVCFVATLAQLVEQQTENLRVWSSILRGGIVFPLEIVQDVFA